VSPRLFGTDGIRGRFGEAPLDEPTVRRIGLGLARRLARAGEAPLVLLAGDTRLSTPDLRDWLSAGLAAGGARPVDLGTLPTAAVALLVPMRRAAAGISLSASHNPPDDNGIKVLGAEGYKWSEAEEAALESELAAAAAVDDGTPAASSRVAETDREARAAYEAWLLGLLPGERPLAGLRIGLDLAHGAAAGWEGLFERLGARVTALFAEPDGALINVGCGATDASALARRVVEDGLDLGVAFDGDADRAIVVDGAGEVRDGDALLYLWALDLAERGELEPRRIVVTTMSNLGLERALATHGIGLERCPVGDRAVVERLRATGLRLGGEQSGHLLDLRRTTTGDGLVTALAVLDIVARSGRSLAELLADFRRFPQILLNVPVRSKPDLATLPAVAAAAREVESRLGAEGRLVLRYSGTEPLCRVMIEGPDEAAIRSLADGLASAIRTEIGADA